VEEVVKTLHTNAGNARAVAAGILQDVHDVVEEGKVLDAIKGSMKFACITRADVSGITVDLGSLRVSADNETGSTHRVEEEALLHPALLRVIVTPSEST
jgi:hypothetical protein